MKLETQRTYIREFCLEDAEAVLAFNGNEQVTQYTGDAGMVKTLTDAKNIIANIWLREYKEYGYGRWAVVEKSSNKVIGFCGLKYLPDVGAPDIGYRFLPECWGKGYATETATACIEYCKTHLGVKKIIGDVMEDNIASVKILQKLGLTFSGYIKEDGQTFMRFMSAA
ncbi:GNAT family N-acetyltransferase [Flocculibacter collagenilyticus]|uniref:GNAT family N-acetyltransferase n=1 Tax=Flocculibacter collagenilyticus TaxID=2744479 RepID=UPI0018F672E5|nr:GNAT family N-acetyltransferase [Flocculibacter collagenilyticus]